jgi:hypothetical protein
VNIGAPTTHYGGMVEALFIQPSAQRGFIMHFAQSMLTPNYEMRTPQLAGLPGWDETLYGLRTGAQIEWSIEAFSEWMFAPADGAALRMLQRSGQITP